MSWGFMDWVRGRPRPAISDDAAPKVPTERKLRRIALDLLVEGRGYEAYKSLSSHEDRAKPILERLLGEDPRFRSMTRTVTGWGRPIYDVSLSVLFKWHSDYAIDQALSLASSPDPALRALAARLLASTGSARFIQQLTVLTADEHRDVREAVGRGIDEATGVSWDHPERVDPALALALYGYILSCALRTDRGPGIGFSAILLRCDRERAIRDLTADGILTVERTWLGELLDLFTKEGITVPRDRIEYLLSSVISIVDRDDFTVGDYPSIQGDIVQLIVHLAGHDRQAARERIEELRAHRQREAREGAQAARERLLPEPFGYVLTILETAGGIDRLRHEHQVVYHVWMLLGEIPNGGWLQWVANPSGEYMTATRDALREIGAGGAADEVQKAIDILGTDCLSSDQRQRMAAIDRMMDRGASLPSDDVICEISEELRARLYDYAEARPEAFPYV